MALKGIGDIQNILAGVTALTASEKIALQKNVIPKISGAARDALAGSDLYEGLIIYNTTSHKLNIRVAAAWEAITSA